MASMLVAMRHSAAVPGRRLVSLLGATDPETQAEAAFRGRHPAYAATDVIDRLRATEYRRFDEQGHTYLDYTGGSVYAESQLREHAELPSTRPP
jgi:hypothetical protein